jgi:signal transduction histidine kinase
VKPELILDIAPGEHLPSGIVTGLAEVGREAVANAARHAAAQHVWVTMRRTRHAVVLEVKDDGTGFEGAGHGGPRRRRHSESRFGLALMQDQMRLLGGTLSIRKVPGEGTTVRASVPLAAGAVAPPRRIRRTATA